MSRQVPPVRPSLLELPEVHGDRRPGLGQHRPILLQSHAVPAERHPPDGRQAQGRDGGSMRRAGLQVDE